MRHGDSEALTVIAHELTPTAAQALRLTPWISALAGCRRRAVQAVKQRTLVRATRDLPYLSGSTRSGTVSLDTVSADMKHLALPVSDQERSRRFYESYLGFDAKPPRRYDDDVLMLLLGSGRPMSRSACRALSRLRAIEQMTRRPHGSSDFPARSASPASCRLAVIGPLSPPSAKGGLGHHQLSEWAAYDRGSGT
jgi:catechol 2,3-dioxygenase-like lactoylglutathione lyase family enzyme